jgi:hypothetical protein
MQRRLFACNNSQIKPSSIDEGILSRGAFFRAQAGNLKPETSNLKRFEGAMCYILPWPPLPLPAWINWINWN